MGPLTNGIHMLCELDHIVRFDQSLLGLIRSIVRFVVNITEIPGLLILTT